MPILLPSDIQLSIGRTLSDDELEEAVNLIDEYTGELEARLGHSIAIETVTAEEHLVPGYFTSATTSSGLVAVTASYTGGHGESHPAYKPAKGAIRRRVIRMLAKRDDDAIGTDSVSAPGLTVKYLDEGFTESEWKTVSKMRRVTVAFDSNTGAVMVPLYRTPVRSVTAVTVDGVAGAVGTAYRVVRGGIEILNLYPIPAELTDTSFR